MDGRPNRENKAAFSYSSGVAWIGLNGGARKLPGGQVLKIKRYRKGLL